MVEDRLKEAQWAVGYLDLGQVFPSNTIRRFLRGLRVPADDVRAKRWQVGRGALRGASKFRGASVTFAKRGKIKPCLMIIY